MADYTFPTFPGTRPLQAEYSYEHSTRFMTSQPASGPYYSQILQDDAPTYFNLSFVMTLQYAQAFRAWCRQDNYAVLNGAQFNIGLPIEDGIVTQVASFTPDGIPQVTGEVNKLIYYSARVLVRKLNEPTDGSEDLILFMAENSGSDLLQVIVNEDMPEL